MFVRDVVPYWRKFDVLKVRVFAQGAGVLAVKIYEPEAWVKFMLLLQI
ncbi:MAG: hypothetical protein ACFNTA_08375 [Campylobacter sp.]|nr:hypothetical protein [uncultured Campylobacter sp.]